MNSNQKGKRGEREFRDVLRGAGFLKARRGQQFSGSPESPDVVCPEIPALHIEVKRCQVFKPYEWIEQAANDADDDQFPTVAFRRNGKRWLIIRYAEHDLEIIRHSDLVDALTGEIPSTTETRS